MIQVGELWINPDHVTVIGRVKVLPQPASAELPVRFLDGKETNFRFNTAEEAQAAIRKILAAQK